MGWTFSELAPEDCVLVPEARGHSLACICVFLGSAGSLRPVQLLALPGLLDISRSLCSQACRPV